ncbi:MAG: Na+/H+ antiporter NhaD/arsenite permease-like protein [Bacteroidia bacterium]|jgi:Na+/H+ antiporter NhaD/arsenite permease-like protein
MTALIIVVFVLGYLAIATEHTIKIDKAASALITGMLCWAIYVFTLEGDGHQIQHIIEHGREGFSFSGGLVHHIFDIGSILFFLMGAMTIVELVDAHEGFAVITDAIKTTSAIKLLIIVCTLTFFLSAVLDNLTTTIVMVSLLRKLIKDKNTRWIFVGMVVISANAGGAWSPIGDVTTTMLWIKGQLPFVDKMVINLIIPSMVATIVPIFLLSFSLKGQKLERPMKSEGIEHYANPTTSKERILIFSMGIGGLVFVPIFKTFTHLPPFMGMMLSLGVLWVTTEIIHRAKNNEDKHELSVIGVLQKVDMASVLFFLGILMAVASLQEYGILNDMAVFLSEKIGNIYAINVVIGFLSSIVDNVPLVAAAQGMYPITTPEMLSTAANPEYLSFFNASGNFWLFLAYCAGVGGSSLIIGSAAGVAAMGLERIDFFWYLKKISWLAISGYLAGAGVYILMNA